MQHIFSLPNPAQLGYKWEEFERAQDAYARIRRRQTEAEQKRRDLELEVNRLTAADRRRLSESWAVGEGDTPEDPKIGKLAVKLREQQRVETALREDAIPLAESKLLAAMSQNAPAWAEEIDAHLPESLEAVRTALSEASESIGAAMQRLLQEIALRDWCDTDKRVYSPSADVHTPSALHPLYELVERVEAMLEERRLEEAEEQPEVEEVTA